MTRHTLHPGAAGMSLILVVLLVVAALAAGFFGVSYLNLKNDFELKQQAAVDEARKEQRTEDEAAERERNESENRSVSFAPVFGSMKVTFPKPWNIYVVEDETGKQQLDMFIHPDVVKEIADKTTLHAFRLELRNEIYSEVLKDYNNAIKKGEVTATAEKVSDIEGTRLNGKILKDVQGTMLLVPLRDKTVMIWNGDPQFLAQFEQIVKNIDLSP